MKYALRFHFYSTFENYLWHINTLILCNGIEWNMVIVGIYFTCLEAVFHLIYTLLWRNKINQIRGEISFSFDTWKLLVADGGGRPAASAGGAARPAAGGRRPGQRGCTDASGCSGPRTVNQCRGTISQVRELSYRPVTVLGCVSSSYVSVWISCYIAAYDLVVYVIFIVYMFWIHTCGI